jgi:hypothetical protein
VDDAGAGRAVPGEVSRNVLFDLSQIVLALLVEFNGYTTADELPQP